LVITDSILRMVFMVSCFFYGKTVD